jgi:hypothetical protein
MGEGLGMMMKPVLRGGLTLIATLGLLAGCSGGSDTTSAQVQLFQAGQEALSKRRAKRETPARPALTRAVLDTVDVPVLEVTIEQRDLSAFLFASDQRRDDLPGQVTIWRTEDDVSLAMRNDVLIATRGLGGDLLSADAPVRSGQPGPARQGERALHFHARDTKDLRLTLACDLVDLGPTTITIVERAHATRHLQERCTGGGGAVTNDYWVDSRAGLVWQSRQWAGPENGYLSIRRLTK